MKFSFKLLQSPDLPWVHWYKQRYSHNILATTSRPSFLWKVVNQNIYTLINHSFVVTYNGLAMFFWLDKWLLNSPLKLAFPHLFSHSINDKVTVATVYQTSLLSNLRDRLTNAASRELDCLLLLLQDFRPSNRPDARALTHGPPLSARNAYTTISADDYFDLHYDFIWSFAVPIKVKIFAWLLFRDWLNTKANLAHKHIMQSAACPRCQDPCEDATHLSFFCSYAIQVW